MEFGDSFKAFLLNQNMGRLLELPNGYHIYLSKSEVNTLRDLNAIADGTKGGVVIGKFHTEGGVHMIQPYKDGYIYCGELEGYEFLCNSYAVKNFEKEIIEINESFYHDLDLPPKPFEIPLVVRRIDVRNLLFPIIIVSPDMQYVINRTSTKLNILRLNRLNEDQS